MEESQVTMVTLLASQDPAPRDVDATELKLTELQRALSISPSQSTDDVEMSGAVGKKMGKAERNLHDRSGTSLSNPSSAGGTPKRAKHNPYSYHSTSHQMDPSKCQVNESTFSTLSTQPTVDSPVEGRLSVTSSGSEGVEKLCNGRDDDARHNVEDDQATATLPGET